MFTPQQYRAKAAECGERLKVSTDTEEARELRDLERSFTTLADNEQWLADNYDRTVHAGGADRQCNPEATTATVLSLLHEEEHVLRCLGAALILQWNTIPPELQRELFDNAGAMGGVLDTPNLRGEIARFLHQHKGD